MLILPDDLTLARRACNDLLCIGELDRWANARTAKVLNASGVDVSGRDFAPVPKPERLSIEDLLDAAIALREAPKEANAQANRDTIIAAAVSVVGRKAAADAVAEAQFAALADHRGGVWQFPRTVAYLAKARRQQIDTMDVVVVERNGPDGYGPPRICVTLETGGVAVIGRVLLSTAEFDAAAEQEASRLLSDLAAQVALDTSA